MTSGVVVALFIRIQFSLRLAFIVLFFKFFITLLGFNIRLFRCGRIWSREATMGRGGNCKTFSVLFLLRYTIWQFFFSFIASGHLLLLPLASQPAPERVQDALGLIFSLLILTLCCCFLPRFLFFGSSLTIAGWLSGRRRSCFCVGRLCF